MTATALVIDDPVGALPFTLTPSFAGEAMAVTVHRRTKNRTKKTNASHPTSSLITRSDSERQLSLPLKKRPFRDTSVTAANDKDENDSHDDMPRPTKLRRLVASYWREPKTTRAPSSDTATGHAPAPRPIVDWLLITQRDPASGSYIYEEQYAAEEYSRQTSRLPRAQHGPVASSTAARGDSALPRLPLTQYRSPHQHGWQVNGSATASDHGPVQSARNSAPHLDRYRAPSWLDHHHPQWSRPALQTTTIPAPVATPAVRFAPRAPPLLHNHGDTQQPPTVAAMTKPARACPVVLGPTTTHASHPARFVAMRSGDASDGQTSDETSSPQQARRRSLATPAREAVSSMEMEEDELWRLQESSPNTSMTMPQSSTSPQGAGAEPPPVTPSPNPTQQGGPTAYIRVPLHPHTSNSFSMHAAAAAPGTVLPYQVPLPPMSHDQWQWLAAAVAGQDHDNGRFELTAPAASMPPPGRGFEPHARLVVHGDDQTLHGLAECNRINDHAVRSDNHGLAAPLAPPPTQGLPSRSIGSSTTTNIAMGRLDLHDYIPGFVPPDTVPPTGASRWPHAAPSWDSPTMASASRHVPPEHCSSTEIVHSMPSALSPLGLVTMKSNGRHTVEQTSKVRQQSVKQSTSKSNKKRSGTQKKRSTRHYHPSAAGPHPPLKPEYMLNFPAESTAPRPDMAGSMATTTTTAEEQPMPHHPAARFVATSTTLQPMPDRVSSMTTTTMATTNPVETDAATTTTLEKSWSLSSSAHTSSEASATAPMPYPLPFGLASVAAPPMNLDPHPLYTSQTAGRVQSAFAPGRVMKTPRHLYERTEI
jgi:hypothetical protein